MVRIVLSMGSFYVLLKFSNYSLLGND
uniref:Uncharacterized protein n=1 Tax=Rhizophora mucronata TaxID=61149 RepID=A0A2P2N8C5_RHIMU